MKTKIIDTHAHYYHNKFGSNVCRLIEKMEEDVSSIINIGTNINSNKIVLRMSEKYEYLYSMIGFFPNDVMELEKEDNMKFFEEHIKDKKNVGIGEIGLDYHWDVLPHDVQEKWFRYQLELAIKNNLPVSIHSRDAEEDTYRILKDYDGQLTGVIHCYSYGLESAKKYLDMGLYFGVGGTSTYKGNKISRDVIKFLPIENILLETDAPYLSPEPMRGKINNSSYIIYVAENIAKIKDTDVEDILLANQKNVNKLFKI